MLKQDAIKDHVRLVDNALSGFILCNKDGIVYANPYCYQTLGYKLNDMLSWDCIIPPNVIDDWFDKLTSVLNGIKPIERMEYCFLKKDGSVLGLTVQINSSTIGNDTYAEVHFQELTINTNNSILVKEKLEQYEIMNENMTEIISQHAMDGKVLHLSPSVKKVTGYDQETLIGSFPCEYIHPEDQNRVQYAFTKVKYTEEQQSVRFRVRCKKNEYIWMETVQKIHYVTGKKQIVAGSKKIDKQIKLEKMLFQAEKLATIGELGVGIVHEIKNPLTSIKGFLQLMKAGTIDIQDYLSILNSELDRIEKIASNVLSYAKPKEEKGKQELNAILHDVYILMTIQATKQKTKLKFYPNKTSIYTLGDETQLKQVFINLIKNAIEASHKGQIIHISVKEENDFHIVQIKDSGVGIPKEKLKQIGESSFTTKDKGTGVGLMVTRRIIKEHQGEWFIESKEGNGTTFTIKLPKL
ncbi:PAS domain-containing sensor histidine kinase [Salirhabdus sp. Marseille-P4669]|uniref:PAS domain-containing sensor histidine kinase n=1 Tax=Salirhabdus sp. Marseille-P4669 TaxID=2042310 RepID=UPI000C7D03D8|nr:PAS domain-containing sensor histidine kinase [Salirhabdus sp. Marseille-P4669]